MARIIQIIEVDSGGHSIRLDTGERVKVPHGHGHDISVGQEWPPVDGRTRFVTAASDNPDDGNVPIDEPPAADPAQVD